MNELRNFNVFITIVLIAVVFWHSFKLMQKKSKNNLRLLDSALRNDISKIMQTVLLFIIWIVVPINPLFALLDFLLYKYKSIFYLLFLILSIKFILVLLDKVIKCTLFFLEYKAYNKSTKE